jgi:hypothetical protein
MSDVELHIPVAEGTRGKDLEVVITKHSVKAGLKGQAPILDKKLAYGSSFLFLEMRLMFRAVHESRRFNLMSC